MQTLETNFHQDSFTGKELSAHIWSQICQQRLSTHEQVCRSKTRMVSQQRRKVSAEGPCAANAQIAHITHQGHQTRAEATLSSHKDTLEMLNLITFGKQPCVGCKQLQTPMALLSSELVCEILIPLSHLLPHSHHLYHRPEPSCGQMSAPAPQGCTMILGDITGWPASIC